MNMYSSRVNTTAIITIFDANKNKSNYKGSYSYSGFNGFNNIYGNVPISCKLISKKLNPSRINSPEPVDLEFRLDGGKPPSKTYNTYEHELKVKDSESLYRELKIRKKLCNNPSGASKALSNNECYFYEELRSKMSNLGLKLPPY